MGHCLLAKEIRLLELLPFIRQAIFFCVGAAFVHHAQNVEQYSDHGQSVTSSLEYCNGKNVSNIQL